MESNAESNSNEELEGQEQGREPETAETPDTENPPDDAQGDKDLALQRALVSLAEKEVESARQAEERRRIEKENEIMKAELAHIEAAKSYSQLFDNDSGVIEEIIGAVASQDHAAIARIIQDAREDARREEMARQWKELPPIHAGSGEISDTYTQAQFDSMNLVEKSKLYREDRPEYERLSGRGRR